MPNGKIIKFGNNTYIQHDNLNTDWICTGTNYQTLDNAIQNLQSAINLTNIKNRITYGSFSDSGGSENRTISLSYTPQVIFYIGDCFRYYNIRRQKIQAGMLLYGHPNNVGEIHTNSFMVYGSDFDELMLLGQTATWWYICFGYVA